MANSTPTTYSLNITDDCGETPVSTDPNKTAILLRNFFSRMASGHNRGDVSMKCRTATASATGTVTAAIVQNADTVTINGQALTATQHNARGTVTMTVSGIDVDDTVTLNGYAFTAKASETLASGYFNIGSTDAAAATSLADCINASTNVLISGLFTAAATAGVCTIRAVTAGTAANSYTLASSDAQAAVSGATLSGGAAVGNNQFDFGGTNAQTATALAAAINASTTNIVAKHVTASASSGVVTITAKIPGHAGNAITLASSDAGRLACSVTRLASGTDTLTTHTY